MKTKLKYNKALILENKTILLKNDLGEEISFTLTDFYKYCPINKWRIDFTGKRYIDYEPDRGVYIDETIDMKKMVAPTDFKDEWIVKGYENLLNKFDEIKKMCDDMFYGLSLEQCKDLKIQLLKTEARKIILKKWPMHKQVNVILQIESGKKTQMSKDIKAVRNTCIKAKDNVKNLKSKLKIKELKVDSPKI